MCDDPSDHWSRREALTILGALAARGAIGAPDQALHASGIDHVAIAVSDVEKSVVFYSRIFGHNVLKDKKGPRRYFNIGNAYVAIAPPGQGQAARRVDHICAGIAGFEPASIKSYLDQRGIRSREAAVGLYVTDPDGIQIQLWTEGSWGQLGRTASPEAAPGGEEALFRPIGLDHVLVRVSDMENSAAFYQKLFGPAVQRGNNPPRIWFQVGSGRLGLGPAGPGPGVDHFCVAVAKLDPATAAKKLQDRGAAMEPGEVPGAPEFRDPDGILLQVTGPQAGGKK